MKTLTGWKTRLAAIKLLITLEKVKFKEFKPYFNLYSKEFPPRDRAFVREITTGTVRYLRLLDFSVEKVIKKTLKKQSPVVRNALRLSAYQLFFTGVPPYAAVNETVEAVKRLLGSKEAGFVNAVSKKLVNFDYKRAINSIPDELERISVFYSFETWMVKRWKEFYGKELEPLLKSLNQVAPLFLRINTLKVKVEDYLKLLSDRGVEFEQHNLLKEMVRIKGRVLVEELPGYQEGYFYVQDVASYLSAYLLEPKKGERILDLGAAPGGKTTALAMLTENEAEIFAVDVSKERMELLKENCKRLGVSSVIPVLTDITKDREFLREREGYFDKILIDAPCSATGVIRRHPEGKWNKSISLIERNRELQEKLIKTSYKLLKPGGVLLYSVCSLEKEEGEAHLSLFNSLGLKGLPFTEFGGREFLRLFPHKDGTDGFFYARFVKLV